MTRDFEVFFNDPQAAVAGAKALRDATLARTGLPLFGEIELRHRSIFVTLTYPEEIRPDDVALLGGRRLEGFGIAVTFVAIENGMHSPRGFVFVSPNTPVLVPSRPVHVAALYDLTLQAAA